MDSNIPPAPPPTIPISATSTSPVLDMRAMTTLALPAPHQNAPDNTPSEVLNALALFEKSKALFEKSKQNNALQKENNFASQESSTGSESISKKRSFNSFLDGDPENTPSPMEGLELEDNSWMNGEDNEEDEELMRITEKYNFLNTLRQKEKITPSQHMDLIKYKNRMILLNRLKNGGFLVEVEEHDENSLFIPETVIENHRRAKPAVGNSSEDEQEDDEDPDISSTPADPQHGESHHHSNTIQAQDLSGKGIVASKSAGSANTSLKKNVEPRKKRAPLPKTAREVFEQGLEKSRARDRQKAQKKKGEPKPSRKRSEKSKSKGGGKKSSDKKSKGKNIKNGESLLRPKDSSHWRNTNEDEIGQLMIKDLLENDPISERINNPVFQIGSEPVTEGSEVKSTAFQRLFSQIPEGSSKKDALSDRQKLKAASKAFGFGKVKAVDGKWQLNGMNSTLYHHQLLGVKWMVERELSFDAPHGGILADSMGLGKTIQTLSCMVANPPMEEDCKKGIKATLLVVPAAIIHQWISEIESHTKSFTKVIHYKTSSKLPISVIKDMDVVVTSYHEVMKQYPFPDAKAREEIKSIGYEAWLKKEEEEVGPLHKINWYRVVLDEAHAIKNNGGRTSLACQNLKSVYRWCLTGTPLMNRLEELFPYLRFLRVSYTKDFKTFTKYFGSKVPDAEKRISTILSFVMMRRTMKTMIMNRPILTLPAPHSSIQHIDFSAVEKIIYRLTENRFRQNLNRYFEQDDAAKHYDSFMVQLLRLRQCTSHPFMLERTIRETWTLEDVAELKLRLSRLKISDIAPFYKKLDVWVQERVEDDLQALPFGQGDFGNTFEFIPALDTLNEKELMERVLCSICSDVPQNPMQTNCGHIFCKECITNSMHASLASDDFTVCPSCERVFTKIEEVQIQGHSSPDVGELDSQSSNSRKSNKKRRIEGESKGMDLLGHEPWTDSTWIPKTDRETKFPLPASSKTAALKAILLNGFHSCPLDKVVIYVQFHSLARIVGRICESEKWKFLYLTGDTTQEHRARAIEMFREDPEAKILIAGLKCGGIGLNLAFANRCISLDLWWNHSIEQQAFGRIFRIGQGKETYFTRIVVRNTIDMRMLTMQLHKIKKCESAIQDGDPSERPRLSLKEVANLFGFLRTDEYDNIISIEPDYDDLDEWNAAGRIDSEPEPDSESQPESQPESQSQPEPESQPEPQSQPEPESRPEPESQSQPESQPRLESESQTQPESQTQT